MPLGGFLLGNNYIMSIINYFKDTQGELKHVNWPSKSQTVIFSIVVILVSIFTAFFLGFFDYIFGLILDKFVL